MDFIFLSFLPGSKRYYYPENRLITISAKAPLEAGRYPVASLVSPFAKEPAPGPFRDQGGIEGDFPLLLDAGSGPAWDRWLRRLR
jgi:hypothetical protein